MPRLVLIAMSGVRIVNPELRALGLTLPGFIERGEVIASMPSLGLLTLAGATPGHWSVEYHEIDAVDEAFIHRLIAKKPDIIAVSSLSARIEDAYAIIGRLKEAGIYTVLGGLHASVLPQEAQLHADTVVSGQGEWIWQAFLSDFENGEPKPNYDGMHTNQPLDSTGLPRFDLLDPTHYNRIPMQTTRGCPLDCAFCAASRLISPYKRKPIARVKQEIEAILDVWEKPFIELADDNTFVNKTWARELAQLMLAYPTIRWFTETDISIADDPELLALLAESGCAQVLIGLESVSEGSLSETDGGQWKRRRLDQYQQRIKVIQDAGISVNGCFVFGFDHDTPDIFERTWEFIQRSELSEVQLTLLTPFPGTQLARSLRHEGRLKSETYWDQCTLFDVVFEPRHFSVSELEKGFRQMVATVYSVEESEKRARRRMAIYRHRKHMQ